MTGRLLVADARFAGWARPGGWEIRNLSRCRGCGAPIAWARSFGGSDRDLNRNGGYHAATCREPDRRRRLLHL